MRQFGLIGNPVAHSLSPEYFSRKWENEGIQDCDYRLFPLQSLRELPELLRTNPELRGLNVTSPFKEEVLAFAYRTTEAAARIGGANVLVIRNRRITIACNTDHLGFDQMLVMLPELPASALVCGTGAAARAVRFSLERHKIRTTLLSRRKGEDRICYGEADETLISQHTLIVNATPLGMGSHIGECPPLPYQALTPNHIMADLNYLPAETLFLQKGKEMGCRCLNGLDMLHGQADAAWEIWEKATESFDIHI